jgi:arabinan endo-1,5-alpha-L-arabinosidase
LRVRLSAATAAGRIARRCALAVAVVLAAWLVLEAAVRLYVEWPLRTAFYGSIPRDEVRRRQKRWGVVVANGIGWTHLGWIADPDRERYRIERRDEGGDWREVGRTRFGSYLARERGTYRVWAAPRDGGPRLLGSVEARPEPGTAPLYVPRVGGAWRMLFHPHRAGDYVNDHCLYRDASGDWRLIGITARGRGDYSKEKRFAVAVSRRFPPPSVMREAAPIADFGDLAWAPDVIEEAGTYHLFWSPHRLHRMVSTDGVEWRDHRVVLDPPFHRFFRDAMVLRVAPGQWLLYATARGAYYSRVDLYQSFDLEGWQYIGGALRSGWGGERNAIVSSMESPAVTPYRGRYYLTVTYNNDSFFWPALLLPMRLWLDRASYEETLVLQSDNPYDFGVYRGQEHTPSLLARLRAHAPEIVHEPESDAWYITTAGWPWAATLTSGEVAVAPLHWMRRDESTTSP